MTEKIKIYENDGRSREEKETCFPLAKTEETRKTKGVSTR